MNLNLAWLYSKTMNLYGDRGNIISLIYRCEKRNIKINVKTIEIKEKFDKKNIDLVFFGGGQDKEQLIIAKDLEDKKYDIKDYYEMGKPMLSVCGGYQLLGDYFKTYNGQIIKGLNIFNMYTIAGEKRMVGNIIIYSKFFDSLIVGFENHSGNTFIKDHKDILGNVLKGYGNNNIDSEEGVIKRNFIGTYLHGPILPKNPVVADWLIKTALEKKYQCKIKIKKIDDSLEKMTRKYIINKNYKKGFRYEK